VPQKGQRRSLKVYGVKQRVLFTVETAPGMGAEFAQTRAPPLDGGDLAGDGSHFVRHDHCDGAPTRA
jgi:hypothetical protein